MSDKLFIKCNLCACEFNSYRSLGIHIKRTHHIETKEYYDKFYKTINDDICKTCGKSTRFLNLKHGYLDFCTIKCVNNCREIRNKIELTNLKRYGVKSTTQNQAVLNKRKENNLKKYGVENPSSLNEIKEKKRLTMLKLYGVENISQSEIFKKVWYNNIFSNTRMS